mgnify:CR=1 FL=1
MISDSQEYSKIAAEEMSGQLTSALVQSCLSFKTVELPNRVVRMAQHCLLDWAAVTLGGISDPLADIITETVCSESEGGSCTLVGSTRRGSQMQAALVNGTISHALDYDDVNSRMHGHPTVAILPAVLAVAEAEGASGADLIRAFVGGFHATSTIGSIAAAAGCAVLLKLNKHQTETALALAATQSAGLKANFGTMAKPLHAGKAASNGVLAARLAQKGFSARTNIFERDQGFGLTMSDDFSPGLAIGPDWEIEDNLFKYHAACYLTHSSIEALLKLRTREKIDPKDVAAVRLHVPEGHRKVCDLLDPQTALDVKFSIRHLAALALYGENTSSLALFSEDTARDPKLGALREKVELVHDGIPRVRYEVQAVVQTSDGRIMVAHHDVGEPARDLDAQEKALRAKTNALVDPILGAGAGIALFTAVSALPAAGSVADYLNATKPN